MSIPKARSDLPTDPKRFHCTDSFKSPIYIVAMANATTARMLILIMRTWTHGRRRWL
ncbi:hypothetical protein EJ08DRAFT_651168 [Tothia fuscella]|uniref:Uncharacterized protein n=1 Tax=Tothia fuscella TaxID=1048955 RepID=A0A9P4NMX6_9PEZI|nr:hypothetical protein EJ08DRAFT_651168 [Tothia fuscella]